MSDVRLWTFANYKIRDILDVDLVSTTYRATTVHGDELCRLRVFTGDIDDGDLADIHTAVIEEARRARRVRHPHILATHDADRHDDRIYVVSDDIHGAVLREFIARQQPVASAVVLDMGWQLAEALDAVHAGGIIHGSINPHTIWVAPREGRDAPMTYLTGFGASLMLARHVRNQQKAPATDDLLYVGPDQMRHERPSPEADRYALACALYHLLTGSPPFRRESVSALFGAHLFSAVEPPTAVRADLPPALDSVFTRALAKETADRYPSAHALLIAVERALRGQADPGPQRGARSQARRAGAGYGLPAVGGWTVGAGDDDVPLPPARALPWDEPVEDEVAANGAVPPDGDAGGARLDEPLAATPPPPAPAEAPGGALAPRDEDPASPAGALVPRDEGPASPAAAGPHTAADPQGDAIAEPAAGAGSTPLAGPDTGFEPQPDAPAVPAAPGDVADGQRTGDVADGERTGDAADRVPSDGADGGAEVAGDAGAQLRRPYGRAAFGDGVARPGGPRGRPVAPRPRTGSARPVSERYPAHLFEWGQHDEDRAPRADRDLPGTLEERRAARERQGAAQRPEGATAQPAGPARRPSVPWTPAADAEPEPGEAWWQRLVDSRGGMLLLAAVVLVVAALTTVALLLLGREAQPAPPIEERPADQEVVQGAVEPAVISPLWTAPFASRQVRTVEVTDDAVLVAAGRDLGALEPASGAPLWSGRAGAKVTGVVAAGAAMVTATADGVTGYDPTSGEILWDLDATALAVPDALAAGRQEVYTASRVADGIALSAIDPATGATRALGTIVDGGTGDSGNIGMAFDRSGRRKGGQQLYVLTGAALHAFDPRSATEVWRAPVDTDEERSEPRLIARPWVRSLAAAGGAVVLVDRDGRVCRYAADTGEPVWTSCQDFPAQPETSPVVQARSRVVVVATPGVVAAYDFSSGTPQWEHAPEPTDRPAVAGAAGLTYVADGDGVLHALDQRSGREQWRATDIGDISALQADADGVYVGSREGSIVRLAQQAVGP